MSQLFYVLVTILGIGFLIFIHEAGHYVCARLAGVRVMVFSLGFGPRLLGFFRGGTDYRISAVPLGGYVRVAGEDPTQREDAPPDGLHAKGVGARGVFFAGGVAMNLLFAFVAFPVAFHFGVDFSAPVIGDVVEGGPAWQARLQPGDRIAEVDGKDTYSFENTEVEIALAGDRPVDLTIVRDGQLFERQVKPRYQEERGVFSIGIEPAFQDEIELLVAEDGPAAAAGLRTGDRLVALQGAPVTLGDIGRIQSGLTYERKPLTVTVERNGERLTVEYLPGWEPLPDPVIGVVPARRRVVGLRPELPLLDRLGLQRGDHIVSVDGVRFAGDTLAPFADGPRQLVLEVERPGLPEPVRLSAEAAPAERAALPDHVGFGYDTIGAAVDPRPGSPAEAAGLRPGDEILAIDGREIGGWSDLQAAVARAGGGVLHVRHRSRDGVRVVELAPATHATDPGFVPRLAPLVEPYRKDTVSGAIQAGAVASIDMIKSLYVTLKRLFTGEVAAKNLGGIITISRVTYTFAQLGWERYLYFLALLSINLAFINVLPIPVLDGGHLMFVVIEAIKGSPVNPKVFGYSQVIGLVFLVALLVFVTYNDILRLL